MSVSCFRNPQMGPLVGYWLVVELDAVPGTMGPPHMMFVDGLFSPIWRRLNIDDSREINDVLFMVKR